MTPAARITQAGSALYGRSWHSDLAAALGVTDRTVRRWAAGETTPADEIWKRLDNLIAARILILREVRAAVRV